MSTTEIQGSALFSVYVGIEAESIDALDEKREQIMRDVAKELLERWDVTEVNVGALR